MEEFKVLRELKGGSFSSTRVIEFPDAEKRVRKSISCSQDREFGLVRWQSQVRRMQHLNTILPNNSPPVLSMGVTGASFYYDIPYYEAGENLHEYLVEGGRNEAKAVFEQIFGLIDEYSNLHYGPVTGSFSVFLSEEVISRLRESNELLDTLVVDRKITPDEAGFVRGRLESSLPVLEGLVLESLSWSISESFTHGNLTLENALYDHRTSSIILIDPYSETYCESILGDISQLMQSSVSNYESVVLQGDAGVEDFFKLRGGLQTTGVNYFGCMVKDYVSTLDVGEQRLVSLFHAAQFIRMFPFKVAKTPRLALFFLLHGLDIVDEGELNAQHN